MIKINPSNFRAWNDQGSILDDETLKEVTCGFSENHSTVVVGSFVLAVYTLSQETVCFVFYFARAK